MSAHIVHGGKSLSRICSGLSALELDLIRIHRQVVTRNPAARLIPALACRQTLLLPPIDFNYVEERDLLEHAMKVWKALNLLG